MSTGTASGKSLCYQLAVLETFVADPQARALFLFPTKALAQDQARKLDRFRVPGVVPAIYDGDTPQDQRPLLRRTATILLSNPDMLHVGILPGHERWAEYLHQLRYVVLDEAHVYRGVFGSHVAQVVRRLRRLCRAVRLGPAASCSPRRRSATRRSSPNASSGRRSPWSTRTRRRAPSARSCSGTRRWRTPPPACAAARSRRRATSPPSACSPDRA